VREGRREGAVESSSRTFIHVAAVTSLNMLHLLSRMKLSIMVERLVDAYCYHYPKNMKHDQQDKGTGQHRNKTRLRRVMWAVQGPAAAAGRSCCSSMIGRHNPHHAAVIVIQNHLLFSLFSIDDRCLF
jgi:hypothetical protein